MRWKPGLGVAIAALAATAPAASWAQQGQGPSLEATLNFIRDKVASQADLSYALHIDDPAASPFDVQIVLHITKIDPQPANCRFNYHVKTTRNGATVQDADVWVPFSVVNDVQLMTLEIATGQVDVKEGHPGRTYQSNPPAWVVDAERTGGGNNEFIFTDASLADRVAKAFAHAAQLCGGLKPEAF